MSLLHCRHTLLELAINNFFSSGGDRFILALRRYDLGFICPIIIFRLDFHRFRVTYD